MISKVCPGRVFEKGVWKNILIINNFYMDLWRMEKEIKEMKIQRDREALRDISGAVLDKSSCDYIDKPMEKVKMKVEVGKAYKCGKPRGYVQ
jgi:hypothetical protein